MKMPDSWIIEFEDYKRNNLSGNNNIYTSFNELELNAVHTYFRWRTKNRFKYLCKNTSLIAKPKKAETLSKIMENATDWVYDGCIDQGRVGASHCELGHALRYEHYAYSPSLNKHIKFGVTCASDFFGIEQEKLKRLSSIQAETLEEIKEIVFIRNTNKHREYIKKYYIDYFNIARVIGDDFERIIGSGWLSNITMFLKLKLPLTESMIKRIEYVRINYYKPKLLEIESLETLKECAAGNTDKLSLIDEYLKLNIHFISLSMDYIKEYANDHTEYREKCKNFVFNQALKFRKLVDKMNELGILNTEKLNTLIQNSKQEVVYMHAKNGDRLATKIEADNKGLNTFIKYKYALGEDKYKLIYLLNWCINGDETSYKESGTDGLNSNNILKIEKSAKNIKSLMAWINDINFEVEILELLNLKGVQYLDSANDEDTTEFNISEFLIDLQDKLYTADISSDSIYPLALDIIQTYKRYNKTLSEKQLRILKIAYNKLNKTYIEYDTSENDSDIVKKAKYIVKLHESGKLSNKYSVEVSIANSIIQYKRATEKQQYRIDKLYKELTESNKQNNNLIFLDEQIERNNKNKIEQDNTNNNIFVDNEKNNSYICVINSTKIPTICEISDALGKGYFTFKE